MKIREDLKDWQIAQLMFGKNTKTECNLVKHIRKHYTIESLTEDWSIICDTTLIDDCGWLIPNECLYE